MMAVYIVSNVKRASVQIDEKPMRLPLLILLIATVAGAQSAPPKKDIPGPMKVIERLTAAEIQLRSPPGVAAAA
jgi:hypothetical protein